MDMNIVFATKVIELSEEKDYLKLRNRICFFDSENLNRVQLDYAEDTLEQCKSLINTPLVAKYVKRNGKDDLGGHEVKLVNGEIEFMTQAVGVNSEVEIIEEDVELVDGSTAKLPCLYCTEILWTRFKNVTSAVKRLFAEGKLHNSWELKSSEYTFRDGIKHITKYTFIGNCLLGTDSVPAYGKAAIVTEMSETNYEYLAAESFGEALEMDISSMPASNKYDSLRKEETHIMDVNSNALEHIDENVAEVNDNNVNEVGAEVGVEEQNIDKNEQAETQNNINDSEDQQSETSENSDVSNTNGKSEEESSAPSENSSMKTCEDIRKMVQAALNALETEDEWFYVSMLFPVESIVLCHNYRMKDLQFVKYEYRIEGEAAILDNREDVELVISPLQINSEIELKNNAIADANNRIAELNMKISELEKCKTELDSIKEEREKSEHAEAVNKLKAYVENSGKFSQEELNSEIVQNAINSLNESWLKAEIADRYVASLSAQPATNKVETSQANPDINIVLSEGNESCTSADVMQAFFYGD